MGLMQWLWETEWRLRGKYQQKEAIMPRQFKVGDRVRLIKSQGPITVFVPVGSTGTVTNIDGDGDIRVQFDGDAGQVMKPEQIEHINPAKEAAMAERTNKVGDRARVTWGLRKDEVGKVIEVRGGVKPYLLRIPKFHDWWCGSEDLAFIERATPTLDNLEAGDFVCCTGSDKKKVMAVVSPGVYVLSWANDFDRHDAIWTTQMMEQSGFVPDTGDEATRLTVGQVAEKLGIKNLHIVKEQ